MCSRLGERGWVPPPALAECQKAEGPFCWLPFRFPSSSRELFFLRAMAADMHATLLALLCGTSDPKSPLSKLSGHSDVVSLIWSLVRDAWISELMAATMEDNHVAFAHVENVSFPEPHNINVNMMPFVMGDKNTLPEELHSYWGIIRLCVSTLTKGSAARIGYLTVHESIAEVEGASQRRPGLHTEGFVRLPFERGCSRVHTLPRWHGWGFGHALRPGEFEGGIFMASNVSDTSHLYNAIVPDELVGSGGDVEHLREVLNTHFPEPPKARTRVPDDPERHGGHAGCARSHMHMGGDNLSTQKPVTWPISLQANELVWMTDRTPHESRALKVGQRRQFFRLVAGEIGTWFAAHSTPNPLGIEPDAEVVGYDKFTGKPPLPGGRVTGAEAQQCAQKSRGKAVVDEVEAVADGLWALEGGFPSLRLGEALEDPTAALSVVTETRTVDEDE
jgi:hypothetical protein